MKNKKDKMDNKVVWKDRVRHLGLPISFTKYSIDEDRLYIDSGFFTTKTDEILLYRILDIKTKRTLWQKIFGVGTITLYSADQTNRTLELKNIKKAKEIHRLISNKVEDERRNRGIIGREMVGSSSFNLNEGNIDIDGDGIPDNNCDCGCENE